MAAIFSSRWAWVIEPERSSSFCFNQPYILCFEVGRISTETNGITRGSLKRNHKR